MLGSYFSWTPPDPHTHTNTHTSRSPALFSITQTHNTVHNKHYTHTHYKYTQYTLHTPHTHTIDTTHILTTKYTTIYTRLWLVFPSPERADRRGMNHCSRLCCCDCSAPQTCPSGSRLWLVFPSPREGRQEGIESLVCGAAI